MVCSIPCDQRHGIGDTPGQGVCRTQDQPCRGTWPGGPLLTEPTARSNREAPCAGRLGGEQQTDTPIGILEAPGVNNRLGNPQPFFPKAMPRSERAQLGMALGEVGTGQHGG